MPVFRIVALIASCPGQVGKVWAQSRRQVPASSKLGCEWVMMGINVMNAAVPLKDGFWRFHSMFLVGNRKSLFEHSHVVASQIRRPQCRPLNAIILIIGTLKMVPLILGNPKP